MKLNLARLALLGLLISNIFGNAPAFAVDKDDENAKTPVFTGQDWHRLEKIDTELSPTFKMCIVRGVYEGAFAVDPENAYERYGPWISFRDVVRLVDGFYSDKANDEVPLTHALLLVSPGKVPTTALTPPSRRKSLVSLEKPGS